MFNQNTCWTCILHKQYLDWFFQWHQRFGSHFAKEWVSTKIHWKGNKVNNFKKLKTESKQDEEENCRYFKLPYIGNISKNTKNKLSDIVRKFCKTGTVIKIAFTSHKISSYFSLKDKKLKNLQSLVVYHFTCSVCNDTYIGCTRRHFETRAYEHLNTDKESHVFKHINSKACKGKTHSRASFKIIDRANSFYTLKIKEAMHIQWLQPAINGQKITSVRLTLCV